MTAQIVTAGMLLGFLFSLGVISTYRNGMKPEILIRNLVACFIFYGLFVGLVIDESITRINISYIFVIAGLSLFCFILFIVFAASKMPKK
jgi:hypothetical protein